MSVKVKYLATRSEAGGGMIKLRLMSFSRERTREKNKVLEIEVLTTRNTMYTKLGIDCKSTNLDIFLSYNTEGIDRKINGR
jgi:hypothetical protein